VKKLIAIIGDLHFDISDILLESQIAFFVQCLIPYCRANGIKILIFEGDVFDNRRHVDIYTKNKILELFQNHLKEFEIYIICGNHDTYYKTTNDINSLKILKLFPNVTVFEEITTKKINGLNFLFVPWLYDLNTLKKWVSENDSKEIDVCIGHFDMIGAKINKNTFSKTGLTKELLYDFRKIFSGHYHTRSIEKNKDREIIYTGTPYQLNFGDVGEDRGFCVLDCETLEHEFIENEVSIKFVSLEYPEPVIEEKVKGNIVNVYISESENIDTEKIQAYIEKVNSFKPIKEPIKRIIGGLKNEDVNVNELKVKSLKELFDAYIGQLKLDDEVRDDVIKELDNLYQDCQKSDG
jgi:DNA repair exonuclease SbcCD nuclease subunit